MLIVTVTAYIQYSELSWLSGSALVLINVNTWMGLLAGKCVGITSYLGQLSLPSLRSRLIGYQPKGLD